MALTGIVFTSFFKKKNTLKCSFRSQICGKKVVFDFLIEVLNSG